MWAALIGGELAAGVGLFSRDRGRRRRAASIAVAVAVAWSALGVQAFARGLVLDNCGCFGVYAAQPLRWWVLVEDAQFVALAVWVRARVQRLADRPEVGPGSAGFLHDRVRTVQEAGK